MDGEERYRLMRVCTEEGGEFYEILNGNVYCRLAYSRRVDCPHCSEERDKNGLYVCKHKKYNEIRDKMFYEEPMNGKNLPL